MKHLGKLIAVLAVLLLVPMAAMGQTTVQSNAAGTSVATALVHLPVGTLVPFYYSAPTTQLDTAADIVEIVNVPNDARIVEILFTCADLDTNANPTIIIDIGDDLDDDRYIADSVVCQAGGTITLTDHGAFATAFRSAVSGSEGLFQYTANNTIDFKISTVAGTAAAGVISGYVIYVAEPD